MNNKELLHLFSSWERFSQDIGEGKRYFHSDRRELAMHGARFFALSLRSVIYTGFATADFARFITPKLGRGASSLYRLGRKIF